MVSKEKISTDENLIVMSWESWSLHCQATVSVIWAMGLLVGMGNTVHIMSSMIPVFLMPIAM